MEEKNYLYFAMFLISMNSTKEVYLLYTTISVKLFLFPSDLLSFASSLAFAWCLAIACQAAQSWLELSCNQIHVASCCLASDCQTSGKEVQSTSQASTMQLTGSIEQTEIYDHSGVTAKQSCKTFPLSITGKRSFLDIFF